MASRARPRRSIFDISSSDEEEVPVVRRKLKPVPVPPPSSSSSSSSSSEEEEGLGECSICYENFQLPVAGSSRRRRLKLSCVCGTSVCYVCMNTYMKTSKVMPSCSKCKTDYDQVLLVRSLPKSYHGYIERYIKRSLLDREMAHAPERLASIDQNGAAFLMPSKKGVDTYEAIQEGLREYEAEKAVLERSIADLEPYAGRSAGAFRWPAELRDRYQLRSKSGEDIAQMVKQRREQLVKVGRRLARYQAKKANFKGKTTTYYDYKGDLISEKVYFEQLEKHTLAARAARPFKHGTTKAIPRYPCGREGCKGMLNAAWQCLVCDLPRCKQCLAHPKPDKAVHICKPDDVASARLIMEDTKPCPECATRIHRVYGCDHMFCTECKTNFNFSTGEILRKGSSNPHYIQWMMERGGDVAEGAQCAELNAATVEVDLLLCKGFCLGLNLAEAALVHDFYMLVDPGRNMNAVLQHGIDLQTRKLEELASRYLYNMVPKTTYVEALYARYLAEERVKANTSIFQVLRAGGEELISKMMAASKPEEAKEIIEGMLALRHYINRSFQETNSALGSPRLGPRISQRFVLYPNPSKAEQAEDSERMGDYNLARYTHIPVFQVAVLGHRLDEIPDPETQYRAIVAGISNNFGLGDAGIRVLVGRDLTEFNFNYIARVRKHEMAARKAAKR